MGVAVWFNTFCSEIQVQDTDSISRRYKAITRRLNTDYWSTTSNTSHSFYVGSFGRNTAVDITSDVDMMFRLPFELYERYDGYYGNGQSALLQDVRSSIKKTYATTNLAANGQVIQIPFKDGITFELVPCFVNENDSYTFPDSNAGGSWRTTNPKPEIEAIRNRNGACNGNLVRLCRMMRAWKAKWSVPIGGLLIDTLAYQFIGTWAHRDKSYLYYDYMSRDFFDYLSNQSKDQDFWKAPGSGQWVYGARGQFQYKATRCRNLAIDAISHETGGREWSAKQKWRKIFGTSFPS